MGGAAPESGGQGSLPPRHGDHPSLPAPHQLQTWRAVRGPLGFQADCQVGKGCVFCWICCAGALKSHWVWPQYHSFPPASMEKAALGRSTRHSSTAGLGLEGQDHSTRLTAQLLHFHSSSPPAREVVNGQNPWVHTTQVETKILISTWQEFLLLTPFRELRVTLPFTVMKSLKSTAGFLLKTKKG